jgi:hypothetical protein
MDQAHKKEHRLCTIKIGLVTKMRQKNKNLFSWFVELASHQEAIASDFMDVSLRLFSQNTSDVNIP